MHPYLYYYPLSFEPELTGSAWVYLHGVTVKSFHLRQLPSVAILLGEYVVAAIFNVAK